MELRRFGTTGIRVSELCLGAMTFGRESDEETSRAILDRYLDAGGNMVDTADVYSTGGSEEVLGRALGSRRQHVVLATKCRFPMGDDPNAVGASRRHIMESVDASLRRLQTDWLDLYQIHCWDPETPLEETLSALDNLVHAGKVRYLGVSNYTGWQLAKALGMAERRGWERIASLQPQYSLIARDLELDLLPLCREDGLAVLPWSPLGGGVLTGKYKAGEAPPEGSRAGDGTPSARLMARRLNERNHAIADAVGQVAEKAGRSRAQVALGWVLHRPGVTAPIIGARTLEQLDDNLAAAGWRLDDEHVTALDDASRLHYGYPHDFHRAVGVRTD